MPDTVHPRRVHVTCSGAGCHTAVPAVATERGRNVCLACHREMTDHKPDRVCSTCHVLPRAESSGEER